MTPEHRAALLEFAGVLERRDHAIIAAYRSGATMREIAAVVGLAPSGVRTVLVRHGVQRRDRGGMPRD